MTSSRISKIPWRWVTSRKRDKKPSTGGTTPALHMNGSTMTAAMESASPARISSHASGSFHGSTTTVFSTARGVPAHHATRLGPAGVAPGLRVPASTDHAPVVGAVERALELRELGPPGERAGQTDGVHRRLGPGVREAHAFDGRHAPYERLGQPDLVLGRAGKRQPPLAQRPDGLDDGGHGVAEHQARVVAVEGPALDAVGVPDASALPALEGERIGIEERRGGAVAPRAAPPP